VELHQPVGVTKPARSPSRQEARLERDAADGVPGRGSRSPEAAPGGCAPGPDTELAADVPSVIGVR
jgi:hypothetical protein